MDAPVGGIGEPTPTPTLSPIDAQNLQRPLTPPSPPSQVPVPLSDPATTAPSAGSSSRQPEVRLNVSPVPDPEASEEKKQVPAKPSLYDPRDRTAQYLLSPTIHVVPIAWPNPSEPVSVRTARSELTPQHQPTVVTQPRGPINQGWSVVRP
jgi:hypothetical protein